MKSWIEELKAGDEVLVCYAPGYLVETVFTVETVARVTPAQVVIPHTFPSGLVRDVRFRKKDGIVVGESYFNLSLRQATPDALAELERKARRKQHLSTLKATRWERLDDATLDKVLEIIAPDPA